jgi:putative endonuclease
LLGETIVHADHRVSLGKQGEELACTVLRSRGYVILDRRYRTRSGEIDIVARDGQMLVFVEVKARVSEACGTAREAVTARKRHQLIRVAADYLAKQRLSDVAVRFDVVTIDSAPRQSPKIDVIRHAFDLNDV